MRYPVVIHPNEHLKMKAQPVTIITDEIVQLLEDMYETMLAHDGIGLAAPQIGKNLQMAVIEIDEERYVFEYEYVENLVERVLAVKSGEEEAESCGSCSYCRKSKKLTDTIEVAELIN